MNKTYLFTSESVSSGHPDKICDQISDAILDEFLKQDKESKVAVECFITNNMLVIGGEAHSNATVDLVGTAKKTIEKIGYDGTNGFNPETAVIICTLHEQSSDIRQGVDREENKEQGAGDQGIMFGYATNENKAYIPTTLYLAHETLKELENVRRDTISKILNPDAKCQYTIEYDSETNNPLRIKTILVSTQHTESASNEKIEKLVKWAINAVKFSNPKLSYLFNDGYELLINPTGRFVIGGPEGDTGLTGRKIIVDTYGGKAPHGGGAFSGKDPSKVDRSAAYMARYIAKNIVAAGLADELTIQLSYAIGVAKPLSVSVFGETYVDKEKLINVIYDLFELTPYGIIKSLDLKRPIYQKTASYGHFGREDFPWEKLDMVDKIKEYF